ncbi:ATPase [Rhizocola hellebori]|uniref:ATPase n=1 Tax=Rhizocola hellebori TaxID=1392758 RepID=A0A8J3Q3H5_9ACTN|nr:SRPBCC family protein [Rhizocola hellebori]GIH02555.1 ATPase [Rhizocola hellebori]
MTNAYPDVRKSVIVHVPIAKAWAIFTDRPIEWWPESHVLVASPREEITFEPKVGGRYFERAQDGTVCQWGTMLEWDPPNRLAMTWRIDGNWQMITDDDRASEIEVSFTALSPDTTSVELAHVKLFKHGDEAARRIHAALNGPSPGETLDKYAKLVARYLEEGR